MIAIEHQHNDAKLVIQFYSGNGNATLFAVVENESEEPWFEVPISREELQSFIDTFTQMLEHYDNAPLDIPSIIPPYDN